MEGKQLIVKKAAEVFLRYGIRSVTMDDLCRELSISKKTLYQHVSDKEELILEVLQQHTCEEQDNYARIAEVSRDAVEELLLISFWTQEAITKVPPVLIYDLRKYHPKVWQEMLSKDFKGTYNLITHNLQKGIAQGLYRAELPVDIAARVFLAQNEGMVQDHIFPGGNGELLKQGIIVKDNLFIRGIATPEGLARLEYYRENGLSRADLSFMGHEIKQA
jgi:AcrR family transcriptional regulator